MYIRNCTCLCADVNDRCQQQSLTSTLSTPPRILHYTRIHTIIHFHRFIHQNRKAIWNPHPRCHHSSQSPCLQPQEVLGRSTRRSSPMMKYQRRRSHLLQTSMGFARWMVGSCADKSRDIQVLKTYGAAPYAAAIRDVEKQIKDKQQSINEKIGVKVRMHDSSRLCRRRKSRTPFCSNGTSPTYYQPLLTSSRSQTPGSPYHTCGICDYTLNDP